MPYTKKGEKTQGKGLMATAIDKISNKEFQITSTVANGARYAVGCTLFLREPGTGMTSWTVVGEDITTESDVKASIVLMNAAKAASLATIE